MPQLHKLKIKQCYYEEIERGVKTFELRKNDRNYQVDDILQFQVIRSDGAILEPGGFYQITYILSKCPEYGLQDGYVILGIKNEGKEHLERIAKKEEEEKQKSYFEKLKESIKDLQRLEHKLELEIEWKQQEIKKIQRTYLQLAYIIGGGNPEDVITEEDLHGRKKETR